MNSQQKKDPDNATNIDIEILHVEEVKPIVGLRPRNTVKVGSPSQDDLKIYIKKSVVNGISDHLTSNLNRELGGLLMGNFCHENDDYYVDISDFIPAQHTEGGTAHLKFTLKTWEAIDKIRESRYPNDEKIVAGWYHSHPNLGVFVSSNDKDVHTQFHSWWQTALVVDPAKKKMGFFRQHDEWLLMCKGVYVYDDTGSSDPISLTYARVPPIRFGLMKQQRAHPGITQKPNYRLPKSFGFFKTGFVIIIILFALLFGFTIGNFISENNSEKQKQFAENLIKRVDYKLNPIQEIQTKLNLLTVEGVIPYDFAEKLQKNIHSDLIRHPELPKLSQSMANEFLATLKQFSNPQTSRLIFLSMYPLLDDELQEEATMILKRNIFINQLSSLSSAVINERFSSPQYNIIISQLADTVSDNTEKNLVKVFNKLGDLKRLKNNAQNINQFNENIEILNKCLTKYNEKAHSDDITSIIKSLKAYKKNAFPETTSHIPSLENPKDNLTSNVSDNHVEIPAQLQQIEKTKENGHPYKKQ